MRFQSYASALAAAVLLVLLAAPARAQELNYDDHIRPILNDNCFGCHNADKKRGDLDLTTYTGLMAGSGSGKIVKPGQADDSILYQVTAHTAEPFMPPKKAPIPEAQLATIKKWINTGLRENAGSAAKAADKPKASLALANVPSGRPAGPPPMPGLLPREPFVHTARATAPIALAHSPWAPLLAVGGQKQVLLYNSDTRELLGVLPFPDGFPDTLTFSRTGALLLVAGGRGAKLGTATLYDVATGKRLAQVGQEYDSVLAADLSPDQARVVIGGPSKLVKVLSVEDGKTLFQIKKHTDWVLAAGYSPDGVLFATGDRAGGLYVWEAASGENFYELRGHTGAVTAIAWRGDSNVLASASEDGSVKLWDMSNGNLIKSWTAHGGGTLDVRFTHDGRLVTAGRDKHIKLWAPDGQGPTRTIEGLPDLATRATFNHDGKRVIGADWTGRIRIWNAEDLAPQGELSYNPPTLAQRIETITADLNKAKAIAATQAASQPASQPATGPATQAAATTQPEYEVKVRKLEGALRHWQRAQAFQRVYDARQADEAAQADARAKEQALAAAKATLEKAGAVVPAAKQAREAAAELVDRRERELDEARDELKRVLKQKPIKIIPAEPATIVSTQPATQPATQAPTQPAATAPAATQTAATRPAIDPLEQARAKVAAAEKALAAAEAEVKKTRKALDDAREALDVAKRAIKPAEAASRDAVEAAAKSKANAEQLATEFEKSKAKG